MAVLGTLTLNEIVIYEVDADPSIGGLAAPSGSLSVMTDGSGIFQKGEGDDFDWIRDYSNSQIDTLITQAKDRANHTGTQLAATISDFTEAAQDAVGNALLDSANIDFVYPDVSNQITADLTDTGVVAGTYSSVTVDAKGRVTEGSNTGTVVKYSYFTNAVNSSTSTTYATIAQLTSESIPIGLYKITFLGKVRTAATNSGLGLRLAQGTATISDIAIKWRIPQGANGTAQSFIYDQTATTNNITSASIATSNTDYVAIGEGYIRITTEGTVAVQFRSETTTAATLQANAALILELV